MVYALMSRLMMATASSSTPELHPNKASPNGPITVNASGSAQKVTCRLNPTTVITTISNVTYSAIPIVTITT